MCRRRQPRVHGPVCQQWAAAAAFFPDALRLQREDGVVKRLRQPPPICPQRCGTCRCAVVAENVFIVSHQDRHAGLATSGVAYSVCYLQQQVYRELLLTVEVLRYAIFITPSNNLAVHHTRHSCIAQTGWQHECLNNVLVLSSCIMVQRNSMCNWVP